MPGGFAHRLIRNAQWHSTYAIHITGLGSDLVRHGLALCPNMTTNINKQNTQAWLRWFEQKMKLLKRRFEVILLTIASVK
jgi:hypothetical protein